MKERTEYFIYHIEGNKWMIINKMQPHYNSLFHTFEAPLEDLVETAIKEYAKHKLPMQQHPYHWDIISKQREDNGLYIHLELDRWPLLFVHYKEECQLVTISRGSFVDTEDKPTLDKAQALWKEALKESKTLSQLQTGQLPVTSSEAIICNKCDRPAISGSGTWARCYDHLDPSMQGTDYREYHTPVDNTKEQTPEISIECTYEPTIEAPPYQCMVKQFEYSVMDDLSDITDRLNEEIEDLAVISISSTKVGQWLLYTVTYMEFI